MSLNTQTFNLPKRLMPDVELTLKELHEKGIVERLWAKDASLWTNEDEARWLGWLSIIESQRADKKKFADFAAEVKAEGFSHVLLMGMGGSSLCPEVLSFTFGKQEGFPELHILDSTDPAQILATENKIDLQKTLFIVSSKSGATLEPNIFFQYFFERVSQTIGKAKAGSRFIAVTDPKSKLQSVAEEYGFRDLFFGDPEIGGRYSALSDFGMIPLAAMGIDAADFLERANEMAEACRNENIYKNPGVVLGAILGTAACDFERDKVTIIASPAIHDLGAWLEQLIAESTGKQGKSLIPIDREEIVGNDAYGCDRLFVYLKVEGDDEKDSAFETLEKGGQPVIRIVLPEIMNLGQEFFRWEFAVAVAGAVMEINPFNQPDVEASKIVTKKITSEYEETGVLPPETPIFDGDGIRLFTDESNAEELRKAVGDDETLEAFITAHLDRIEHGDYFGLLAYIEMNRENEKALQEIRHSVLESKKVATCLGFGPRFLHSTGQAYKGGANSGVFLQITCEDDDDLQVPGQKYTFGVVKAAQARGDFEVLAERKRRALRLHLGTDVERGLARLHQIIKK
jgi:glucose-6-phosphate isomerase